MSIVIKAHEISKRYLINHQGRRGHGMLREVIAGVGGELLQRFSTVRDLSGEAETEGSVADQLWALHDISFEVSAGEVVGIIGHNGAGKSTLLKILSRITEPTSGYVGMKGQVNSLLEVGTGFHGELTGRENVFLNGSILGMSRAMIQSKFDEIVAFAEVERFLDTPIKRYSSGMQVRLAFAIAAHLESQALIVDEVLAVGDRAFQKKCLAKMRAFAADGGRAILFVSHSMSTVTDFCSRCLLLDQGLMTAEGSPQQVVGAYLGALEQQQARRGEVELEADRAAALRRIRLGENRGEASSLLAAGGDLVLGLILEDLGNFPAPQLEVAVENVDGQLLLHLEHDLEQARQLAPKGRVEVQCRVSKLPLVPGEYWISITFKDSPGDPGEAFDRLLPLQIVDSGLDPSLLSAAGKGLVLARSRWEDPTLAV